MKKQFTANVFETMGVIWAEIADKDQTSRQISFLRGRLGEVSGFVLDVGCGTGRHSIPLAEFGFEVVGLDASRRMLRIAKQRSHDAAVVLGDMRFLPFHAEAFTAAISVDTSFGYLPTEEADRQSLAELRLVLRQGGKFILDVFNRDQLQGKYMHQGVSKRLKWAVLPLLLKFRSKRLLFWAYRWFEYPSFWLLQKRVVGEDGGWLCDFWVVYVRSTRQMLSFRHRVRLYRREHLESMLANTAFSVRHVWGDYELQPFNMDASRMILVSAAS